MSLSLVETAIITRLRGDATLVALLAGGASSNISTNLGPAAPNYPYVVLETTDEEDSNAFRSDGVRFTATLHVYAHTGDGQVAARSIIERIRGEATTAPSYGLNRHSLNLSDGTWTGGVMLRSGGTTAHDRDTLHYMETYTGHISRPITGS